jgi:hypothetical protein
MMSSRRDTIKAAAMDDYVSFYSRVIKTTGHLPSDECNKVRSAAIKLNGKAAVADQTRYMKAKFIDLERRGAK